MFLCGKWGGTADFDLGNATVTRSSSRDAGQGYILKMTQGRGAVSGLLFNDLDGDGLRDSNEIPLPAGTRIYLDLNNSGAFEEGEPSALSNAYSSYLLTNVTPGSYTIRQVLAPGWSETAAPASHTVLIDTDGFVGSQDFGANAPMQTNTYTSTDVPKKSPSRHWQTTQSKLTINDSYTVFGIDLSITATNSQTRLTLIAPDGAAFGVETGITHLDFYNYKNIQGTWTLQVGTFDGWPSYSVTGWSMTVLGQANAPAPPGITVTPTSGLVTSEAGGSAQFSVVLNSPPTANVTIGVSSSDTTEGSVSVSSLTFTPQNWSTPQTVTVTGRNDTVRDGDIAYTIVLAPAVSSDPGYNGLDPADVAVTNKDNEKGKINTISTLLVTTSSLTGDSTEPAPTSGAGNTKTERLEGSSKSTARERGRDRIQSSSPAKKNVDAVFADWDDPLRDEALEALIAI